MRFQVNGQLSRLFNHFAASSTLSTTSLWPQALDYGQLPFSSRHWHLSIFSVIIYSSSKVKKLFTRNQCTEVKTSIDFLDYSQLPFNSRHWHSFDILRDNILKLKSKATFHNKSMHSSSNLHWLSLLRSRLQSVAFQELFLTPFDVHCQWSYTFLTTVNYLSRVVTGTCRIYSSSKVKQLFTAMHRCSNLH